DQTVLTVHGAGLSVTVPMRCLFVLTGLGFLGPLEQGDAQAPVRVFATDSWLRIDAHFGAVVRQRRSLLPLLI
ncbi:MAG: hypothetical protein ACRDRL_20615, partial [Sciscionella sp.]